MIITIIVVVLTAQYVINGLMNYLHLQCIEVSEVQVTLVADDVMRSAAAMELQTVYLSAQK